MRERVDDVSGAGRMLIELGASVVTHPASLPASEPISFLSSDRTLYNICLQFPLFSSSFLHLLRARILIKMPANHSLPVSPEFFVQ
ncbi:hypothetical protein ACFXTH_000567 [Malus domestica]